MPSDQEVLRRINESIPKELKDNLLKKDRNSEELVEGILDKSDVSLESKRKLDKAMERGEFASKREQVDENVAKKIDVYLDRQIKEAMRSGALKPQQKDAWMRRMEDLQRRHGKK